MFPRSKRRVRGAASRVQGDSVLQTADLSTTGSVTNNTNTRIMQQQDDTAFRNLSDIPSVVTLKKQPGVVGTYQLQTV